MYVGPVVIDGFKPSDLAIGDVRRYRPWFVEVVARHRESILSCEMFVSDLRHFLDMPDDVPGPARRMAEHLESVVRAATAANADIAWESAVTCRRRPGNRRCPGHIAVFRPDPPSGIEWRCTSCGDEGVISGWEDSDFDLRMPRAVPVDEAGSGILITDEVAATLHDLAVLDTDCERLVFRARVSSRGIALPGNVEDLDRLIGRVAAEANHETNRRRQKRLVAAEAALSDALVSRVRESGSALHRNLSSLAVELSGRWRIVEMDHWDRDALDLVGPAFIEFGPGSSGSFGFVAVTGWMDTRPGEIDGHRGVEFTWDGTDEGDQVSGRGWATLGDNGKLQGHIYFHLGDDSGFQAVLDA